MTVEAANASGRARALEVLRRCSFENRLWETHFVDPQVRRELARRQRMIRQLAVAVGSGADADLLDQMADGLEQAFFGEAD
jgi:hypothetical protein